MRRLGVVALTFVSAALLPRGAEPCSMCHCGDPAFTLLGSQIFVPNVWHVGFGLDRFDKDQVAEDDPATREEEVENRFTFSVSRTFGQRLTLVGRVPVSQRTITTVDGEDSATGLSDPELLAHYRLVAPKEGTWLSLSLGLRSGWGQNNVQRSGERAEEHLQPGTGAAGISPGLSFSRVVGEARSGSIFGSVLGRFNGRNDAGYHYGDAFLGNLGYERRLGDRFNAVLEANFRWAAKDEPAVGEEDPNTGGSVLYVSPTVLLRVEQSLFLRFGVQIPVVKSLYGDQDEKVNLLTGFVFRF